MWYCMPYRPDFLKKMRKYRKMPVTQLKDQFQQMMLLEEQKAELNDTKEKLISKKEWIETLQDKLEKSETEKAELRKTLIDT